MFPMLPDSFEIVGLLTFVIGFIWAAHEKSKPHHRLITALYYGWSLGFVHVLTIGDFLMRVAASGLSQMTIRLIIVAFSIVFAGVGIAAAWIGFRNHGYASWGEVLPFCFVSILLTLTLGMPLPMSLVGLFAMPFGSLVGAIFGTQELTFRKRKG